MPITDEIMVKTSFTIPDMEPLNISHISMQPEIGNESILEIIGTLKQKLTFASIDAIHGNIETAPFHVKIPDTMLIAIKTPIHFFFSDSLSPFFNSTISRTNATTATAAAEFADISK